MATEPTPLEKARAVAAEAQAAAERAHDAEQVAWLDSVKNVKELNVGTSFQQRQLRTRYITLFGLPRWTALVANSR